MVAPNIMAIFVDIVCYNHSRVFDACFTISMNITVILAVMPILPLNVNNLSNYCSLKPKNYLEVGLPEWQHDSWSGNC